MEKQSTTKKVFYVTSGGMSSLNLIPDQNASIENCYFDEHDTYAPGKFRRSRRMTCDELLDYQKNYCRTLKELSGESGMCPCEKMEGNYLCMFHSQ